MHARLAEPRILTIDTSPALRLVVARLLILAGYAVGEVATAAQALLQIDRNRPQLILLNPRSASPSDGHMVIFWAHRQRPPIPVVLLFPQPPEAAEATPLDADGWVAFPISYDHLVATIRRLI